MKKYLITIAYIFIVSLIAVFISGLILRQGKPVEILSTSDNVKIAIRPYKTGHNEVLIIAPGWFMCGSSKPFADMAKDFSNDFDVITMDFRGHCNSNGRFTFTSKEYLDLQAVIEYAKKHYKKVYVAGFSLGSATAVIEQHKFKNADKLILVSPPEDFESIENHVWKKEAFVPTIRKFELETWTGIVPGELWLHKIRPKEIISDICPTPVLIIAGKNDPTIYVKHSENLYKSAKEPKQYVVFNSLHAEDIYLQNRDEFIRICTKWLKE